MTIYDDPMDELEAAADADELCGLLLESARGWGNSTRPVEAVELLRRVAGRGELPTDFAAMLLCTCDRWYRCTAKLVAALEGSGLLTSTDLDELTTSFLSNEIVIDYPIGLVHPGGIDLADGSGNTTTVGPRTLARTTRRPEPPLRRWAAARALRSDPAQLTNLLGVADTLVNPRHRDAVIGGLLDAGDAVEPDARRPLVRRGLRSPQAAVRRRALDRFAELDGPDAARRRALADRNARVRAWRPPTQPATGNVAAQLA